MQTTNVWSVVVFNLTETIHIWDSVPAEKLLLNCCDTNYKLLWHDTRSLGTLRGDWVANEIKIINLFLYKQQAKWLEFIIPRRLSYVICECDKEKAPWTQWAEWESLPLPAGWMNVPKSEMRGGRGWSELIYSCMWLFSHWKSHFLSVGSPSRRYTCSGSCWYH